MAKTPPITTISSGFNSTTDINQNFEAVRDAFENVLSLDGSIPNAMGADLDMNGFGILNADSLTINGTDILSLLNRITVSTAGPSGGREGDIWFKVSS